MKYEKPEVVAQNSNSGSFAAGCPAKDRYSDTGTTGCLTCERTK